MSNLKEFTVYTASGNTTGVVNASATIVFPATPNKRLYLHYVMISLASGLATSTFTIDNGTDTIFDIDVRATGLFNLGIPTLRLARLLSQVLMK